MNASVRKMLSWVMSVSMLPAMVQNFVKMDLSECPKVENLTGQTFGLLRVVRFAGKTNGRIAVWDCLCACGKETTVRANWLKFSQQSCGCEAAKNRLASTTTHGMTKSREYNTWQSIKKRCRLVTDQSFKYYGGRGIDICDEWYDSFENFLADMGPRPPRMMIERVDNELGYFKGNCIWAGYRTESRNRRSTRHWTHKGETKCITDWAEATGIKKHTLRNRVYAYGWSVEKALTYPIRDWTKTEGVKS